jgi:hypothetical protein
MTVGQAMHAGAMFGFLLRCHAERSSERLSAYFSRIQHPQTATTEEIWINMRCAELQNLAEQGATSEMMRELGWDDYKCYRFFTRAWFSFLGIERPKIQLFY